MHLDEFLNAQGIGKLQTIQWVWAPATRRSSSKSELLRLLRRVMLSPEALRARYAALEEAEQGLLRGLLRREGYEGDADLIARRLPGPPTPQGIRQLLDGLARQGFVVYTATARPGGRERLRATMPEELGDALAEALNLDTRDPALMLSLRRQLATAGRRRRPAEGIEALTDPGALDKRIAALRDAALARAARIALEQYAGVLPLGELAAHGLDPKAVDRGAWRRALEQRRVGTVGHLSLPEYGFGDDHECLVVYQEHVVRRAAAQATPEQPVDHVHHCGIDFVTDVGLLVDFVRAAPCKLTSAGRFFKGARNQLLPRTACRGTCLLDEDSLLDLKLAVARELNLLELRGDERMHASRAGRDWQSLPLVEQARTVLDVLFELGQGATPPAHFHGVAAAAQQALAAAEPDAWCPAGLFLGAAFASYLLRLLEEGLPMAGRGVPAAPALRPLPRPEDTCGAVSSRVAEMLLRALYCAGLVDLGCRGEVVFVRPTPLVPIVLGDAPVPEPPPGRLVLVNPDFEVILFPEASHLAVLHRLCGFCEREKSEVTIHLRITRESIQRAALRGVDPEGIIATLRTHCRVPLSQNIEYSIRNWAASVHPAAVETLHVLELPSAELADAACRLPEIAPHVVRRISPTALALLAPELGQEAQDALAKLGVYLT